MSGVVIRVETDTRDIELCSEPTVPPAEEDDVVDSRDSEDVVRDEFLVSGCLDLREDFERTFGKVEVERASAIALGSMSIAADVREVRGET